MQRTKKFAFPDKFIKYIHNPFFGNSISVNKENSSLANSFKHKKRIISFPMLANLITGIVALQIFHKKSKMLFLMTISSSSFFLHFISSSEPNELELTMEVIQLNQESILIHSSNK